VSLCYNRIKSQTRPSDQWDLENESAPYMLHVLTKVWEALQRFLKEVQKGAPTEGATAISLTQMP